MTAEIMISCCLLCVNFWDSPGGDSGGGCLEGHVVRGFAERQSWAGSFWLSAPDVTAGPRDLESRTKQKSRSLFWLGQVMPIGFVGEETGLSLCA